MLGFAAFEAVSFFAIPNPYINGALALFLGVVLFLIALKRPTFAFSILISELLIGSKGALFKFGSDALNHGGFSIRMIFFAAFLFGWIIWAIKRKTWKTWKTYVRSRWVFAALAAMLIYAFVLGWFFHQRAFLISDANAWGFWLLLLPALDLAEHERDQFTRDLITVIFAGIGWLALQTVVFAFLFSHQLVAIGSRMYLWIRQSGLGEITKINDHAYRIFFQSQIYAVFGVIGMAVWAFFSHKRFRGFWILFGFLAVEIFLSLSRSFWIGLVCGVFSSLILTLCLQNRRRQIVFRFISMTVALFIGLTAVWGLFALPPNGNGQAFFSLFSSRVNLDEPAAQSRWELLPVVWHKIFEHPFLGSGFGSTVNYQSKDPRIIQQTGGTDTAYAIEWGWLEFWIKFGLLGIPLMLWVIFHLARGIWQSAFPVWFRIFGLSSITALALIHIFTPYLNHPLGITVLILGEAWIKKRPV
ncbi:MAG TPA: O-antigen ligase family protein [Patescibacteria group bacterium]|nr:O-antigen ligase family protein [Patescibacteria group bacterium]